MFNILNTRYRIRVQFIFSLRTTSRYRLRSFSWRTRIFRFIYCLHLIIGRLYLILLRRSSLDLGLSLAATSMICASSPLLPPAFSFSSHLLASAGRRWYALSCVQYKFYILIPLIRRIQNTQRLLKSSPYSNVRVLKDYKFISNLNCRYSGDCSFFWWARCSTSWLARLFLRLSRSAIAATSAITVRSVQLGHVLITCITKKSLQLDWTVNNLLLTRR